MSTGALSALKRDVAESFIAILSPVEETEVSSTTMSTPIIAKYDTKPDKSQVNWGGNDDPSRHLVLGLDYEVKELEVHSFHTKVHLLAFPGLKFNSGSFTFTPEDAVTVACAQYRDKIFGPRENVN